MRQCSKTLIGSVLLILSLGGCGFDSAGEYTGVSTLGGQGSSTSGASRGEAPGDDETAHGGHTSASATGVDSDGDEAPAPDGSTGNPDPSSGETGNATATGDDGSSDASTGQPTGSTGEQGPGAIGTPCADSLECDAAAGLECCKAKQCKDTCMIPCGSSDECPGDMGCQHGYCLFPCDDDDADCAAWPGYTCEHGGELCENGAG